MSYLSIVSGLLLTVSEVLPYISQVKGNSISEVVLNALGKMDAVKQDRYDVILEKLDGIQKDTQKLVLVSAANENKVKQE